MTSGISYDQVIRWGVSDPQGELLWSELRGMRHNQILSRMREEQETVSRAFAGRDRPEDQEMKRIMVRRGRLYETFAWRVYMFGAQPTALYPGWMGELRKRQRSDFAYRKMLDQCNRDCGTGGCEQLENMYRKVKRPCAVIGCIHQGQKKADKWLKVVMRHEWDAMTRRYRY